MNMSVLMILGIICILIYRILLARFCNQVDYQKRLLLVAGMILAYTAVVILMINMAGSFMLTETSVEGFKIYVCIMIFAVNVVFGFITIIYCSTVRRRSLSSREKIKLKDL